MGKATSEWADCPVCGECDMPLQEVGGQKVVRCCNEACASNGGGNDSARRAARAAAIGSLSIMPMSSAPKPKEGEHFKLLALDEWTESGVACRGWRLVYWLDAFDGRPAGWHGSDCGDLRHPLGWVLATSELPPA